MSDKDRIEELSRHLAVERAGRELAEAQIARLRKRAEPREEPPTREEIEAWDGTWSAVGAGYREEFSLGGAIVVGRTIPPINFRRYLSNNYGSSWLPMRDHREASWDDVAEAVGKRQ